MVSGLTSLVVGCSDMRLSDVSFRCQSVQEACPANGLSKCGMERTQSTIQTKQLNQLQILDRIIPDRVTHHKFIYVFVDLLREKKILLNG